MSAAEPQRFFFCHLQKTGGTALFQRLRDQFGRAGVYPQPDDQFDVAAVIDVGRLRERFAVERDRLRVITGHFPLCTTEVLGVPFTCFTVLREPVERTISFLRHQVRDDPNLADSSLEELYEDPDRFSGLIHNHMVKMLSLRADEMTDGALTPVAFDRVHIERARQSLTERIELFGLQEEFDAFCAELERRYGWDLGVPRFANRNFGDVDVDPTFRRRIAEDNALDVELYDFARGLWADRTG